MSGSEEENTPNFAEWFHSFRSSSQNILTACKKDFDEFVETMAVETTTICKSIAQETNELVGKTVLLAKEAVGKIGDEFDNAGITQSLPGFSSNRSAASTSSAKSKEDESNFLCYIFDIPNNEKFQEYQKNFILAEKRPLISQKLMDQNFLRNYSKIVPCRLSFQEFWQRYFFLDSASCNENIIDEDEASSKNASESMPNQDSCIMKASDVGSIPNEISETLDKNEDSGNVQPAVTEYFKTHMSVSITDYLSTSSFSKMENASTPSDVLSFKMSEDSLSSRQSSVKIEDPKTMLDPNFDEEWSDFK